MVYKVCEFKGTPRLKRSEEAEKTTIPGSKKVLRAYNTDDQPIFDVLCLDTEEIPKGEITVFDRVNNSQHTASKVKLISELLFCDGKSQVTSDLKLHREFCLAN